MFRSRAWAASAAVLAVLAAGCGAGAPRVTEFCLEGQFDIGVRLQGTHPGRSEPVPTSWCVISEEGSDRVHLRMTGRPNPDMEDSFALSYLPPDGLRIVNRRAPPDIEFAGAEIVAEAARARRLDPRRLVEEVEANPDWTSSGAEDGWRAVVYPGSSPPVEVQVDEGRLRSLRTTADLPLRGTVPVTWSWDWTRPEEPEATLLLAGETLFTARGSWRALPAEEAAAIWELSDGVEAIQVPGDRWPSAIDMNLETLAEGVYLVQGVRTGFHHLVVDTDEGLVVGDAPAGWVEMHQIPPADMVGSAGMSGLSEGLVDFLAEELPGRPVRAVALTHAHDDHAGGARAFAAAGAEIYVPAETAAFLHAGLSSAAVPADRLTAAGGAAEVIAVTDRVALGSGAVEIVALGASPHTSASLGLWAVEQGFFFQSDLHVPRSEDAAPRPGRAVTECWFARWAVDNLPEDTVVVSSHAMVRTPVSRLARMLGSDRCR